MRAEVTLVFSHRERSGSPLESRESGSWEQVSELFSLPERHMLQRDLSEATPPYLILGAVGGPRARSGSGIMLLSLQASHCPW